MTNYDAISAMLYPYDVDRNLIEKQCIDFGVNSEDYYSAEGKSAIARIAVAVLSNLLVLNSESDSGFSLSYSTDGLKKRIKAIAKDNGMTDIAEEFNDAPKIEFLDLW